MKVWRYQVQGQVEVDAPVDQVYAMAADPEIVPSYVPEVCKRSLAG